LYTEIEMESRSQERLAWAATAILCLGVGVMRFRFLAHFDGAVGVDGYYYPIQIRSLLEGEGLYYPSAPLILWLMAAVDAVVGEAVLSAKLVAAFGSAAIAVPTMGLCRRLDIGRWPSVLAAALVSTAPSAAYMSAEFAKNGVAFTIVMFFLWSLSSAHRSPSRKRVAVSVALFVLVVLAHKLAAMFALGIAFATVVQTATHRRRWLAGAFLAAAGLAVLGVVTDGGGLFARAWTRELSWTFAVYDLPSGPLRFGGDVVIAAIAAAVVVVRRLRGRPVPDVILALSLWVLLVALPFLDVSDPSGLGPRLRLSCFVCAGPIIGWLAHLGIGLGRFPLRWRVALCLGIALGLLLGRGRPGHQGVATPHPEMLRAIARLPANLVSEPVVIVPERSLVFATVWLTRMPAQLRPEGVAPERRLRLLPMWFVSPELGAALRVATTDPPVGVTPPLSLHPNHELGALVVVEETWRWLLEQLPPAQVEHYRAWPVL